MDGHWNWVSGTTDFPRAIKSAKKSPPALKTNIWMFQVTPTVTFINILVYQLSMLLYFQPHTC